jgi:hypothetical protein
MFLNTFTLVSISTLLISSIFNFIKIMFNLRLIDIIENRKCKQKTKIRKRKQKQ